MSVGQTGFLVRVWGAPDVHGDRTDSRWVTLAETPLEAANKVHPMLPPGNEIDWVNPPAALPGETLQRLSIAPGEVRKLAAVTGTFKKRTARVYAHRSSIAGVQAGNHHGS